MSNEYSYELPNDLATLAAVMMVMRTAWVTTLKDLAQANGNKPGPWLDHIEDEVMRNAKSWWSNDIPIDHEAQIGRHTVRMVEDVFSQMRGALDRHNRRDQHN